MKARPSIRPEISRMKGSGSSKNAETKSKRNDATSKAPVAAVLNNGQRITEQENKEFLFSDIQTLCTLVYQKPLDSLTDSDVEQFESKRARIIHISQQTGIAEAAIEQMLKEELDLIHTRS